MNRIDNKNIIRNTLIVLSGLALIFLNVWLLNSDSRWFFLAPGLIIGLVIFMRPYLGLLLFVLFVPLESSFLSFGGGVISGTRFLVFLVFGAWLLEFLAKRRKLIIPSNLGTGFVFLAWGILSFVWAMSRSAATERMMTAAQLLMLTILIVNIVKDQKQIKQIITALFIGCFIAAFLGLIGVGVKPDSYLLTLENQGAKEYGAYVGIVFLIGLFLIVYGQGKSKVFGVICLLMTIVPLIRINQRGVFLAIAIAWLVIAFITRQKLKMILMIVLFFVTIDLLTSFLLSSGAINSYIADRMSVQSLIDTGGTGRAEIWGTAWRMFKDNFLLGVGWGNFPVVYNRYSSEFVNVTLAGSDPHSDIIGVACELGIIGFSVFLFFFGKIFTNSVKLVQGNSQLEKNLIAILVIALLAYCFSIGLATSFIWRKVYWVVFGLALILPRLHNLNVEKMVSR